MTPHRRKHMDQRGMPRLLRRQEYHSHPSRRRRPPKKVSFKPGQQRRLIHCQRIRVMKMAARNLSRCAAGMKNVRPRLWFDTGKLVFLERAGRKRRNPPPILDRVRRGLASLAELAINRNRLKLRRKESQRQPVKFRHIPLFLRREAPQASCDKQAHLRRQQLHHCNENNLAQQTSRCKLSTKRILSSENRQIT